MIIVYYKMIRLKENVLSSMKINVILYDENLKKPAS